MLRRRASPFQPMKRSRLARCRGAELHARHATGRGPRGYPAHTRYFKCSPTGVHNAGSETVPSGYGTAVRRRCAARAEAQSDPTLPAASSAAWCRSGRLPAVDARCVAGRQYAAHRRQLDLAGPLQHQQQTPANHVAQCPVGLFPAQRLAQLPRQLPTAAVRMLSNELSQESNLLTVDRLPAIAPRFRFRHNRSMPEMKAERKPFVGGFFNLLFATPTRLLFPGCPPPTATAPDAPGAHGRALCRSATTRIAPATAVSAPARTLGRHRSEERR